MVKRHGTGRSLLLWLLVLVIAAGAAVAIYHYGIPAEVTQSV